MVKRPLARPTAGTALYPCLSSRRTASEVLVAKPTMARPTTNTDPYLCMSRKMMVSEMLVKSTSDAPRANTYTCA